MDPSELQKQFFAQLQPALLGEEVFDEVPDTVYFFGDLDPLPSDSGKPINPEPNGERKERKVDDQIIAKESLV